MSASLDPASEQAIDWMIALRADPSQCAGFERWLAADAAHGQAWARLQERAGAPFDRLRALDRQAPGHAQQAREVLLEPLASRRSVLRGMAALGLLGGGGWLAVDNASGHAWLADYSTGTGERRRLTLPDGSLLTLNARSAVDLRFNEQERCILLRRGELIVEARDQVRPLRILSAQAALTSQGGGRWMVSQESSATVVLALAGSAQVQRLNSQQTRTPAANEALRIDAGGIRSLGRQPHWADWVDGMFSAVDAPLETLVDALRPYRAGLIHVSADARQLRVQGVFALDRPDQALEAMAQTLPLRIERYTPWLVLISRRV